MGVCHGLDALIWWGSGYRADYTDADKVILKNVVEPFGRFLYGEDVGTGGERYLRLIDPHGEVREDHEDELWERGMRIWERVWEAQRELAAKEKEGNRL